MDKAIVTKGVSKKYKLYDNSNQRLLDLLSPKSYGDNFYALSNVNFEANKGEVIGFVGVNGSGKSTLSNIIAGIVPETSGTVTTNGQVSLIAVAAGLKDDLSGRDNIELKLLMLGFNKQEIKELETTIIEFAELEQFIDQPVKSYSSGMKSRLGFAISVSVNPDILIIDEALSVGDKAFAGKSLNKMKEFKASGKTMIFVSHSTGQMKQFCDKILWLEFGMIKEYGDVEDVISDYEVFLKKWQLMNSEARQRYKDEVIRQQSKVLNGVKDTVTINIDDYYKEKAQDYIETPISIIGHIRSGQSSILKNPKRKLVLGSSDNYKNQVFFIKKQARYNNEIYYLLSLKESTVEGVVGWMRASDMSVHRHVFIEKDVKKFNINGKGKAYDKPWGGKRNCVINDLTPYKDKEILVTATNMIGNNVWYESQSVKPNQAVWIHESQLMKKDCK